MKLVYVEAKGMETLTDISVLEANGKSDVLNLE